MANYAVIENGKVVNICIAEPSDIKPSNWILCELADIGWDYIDGQFIDNRPIPELVEVPLPTKEQLFAQLQAIQAQIQALA